jgi:prophage maintenance system killer protein
MIALEVADLVLIASRTLGLDTGQVLDLLDPAAAEQALAQAQPRSEPGDPATCAAVLLHALVRERPLLSGNRQVALAAMLQFLALNGQGMDPEPPELTAAVVTRIAAGSLEIKDVADWLAPRLRPSGAAAAWAKEAPMRARPALPLAERIKRATMRTKPKSVFARFTDRARRVIVLAQHEARGLGHGSVGTEHLLLGLLAEGEGVAALVLKSLGMSLEEARDRVQEIAGRGQGTPAGHIPFTPRLKKVLELSLREALQLGHTYIGTEHLLLSLLTEGDGIPAQVLARRDVPDARVRERVVAWVTGRYEQEWAAGVDVRALIAENQRMHRELDRLRDLLRQHGIEPDGGTARTA